MMGRKRDLICFGLLLIPLLAFAHHAYWYRPRLRAVVPDPTSAVAAQLDNAAASMTVWVPFPHQNLPRLRDELGLDNEALIALADLAGLPGISLPSLGPLSLPPSNELAFSVARHGEAQLLTARVYPAMALFARLAGRLARNPWLSGGQVAIEQHTAWTRWEGLRWTLSVEGADQGRTPAPSRPLQARSLAIVDLRESEILPAGRYRLVQSHSGFDLESKERPPAIPWFQHPALAANDVAMLLVERSVSAPGSRSLFFFAQPEDELQELPHAASMITAEQRHWTLPGESLLGLTGRDPVISSFATGQIAALDSRSLERARRLQPHLLSETSLGPGTILWLDLEAAQREARRIGKMFEHIPLIPAAQRRRWQNIARLSQPLAKRFSHLTLVITHQPRALHLHLKFRHPSTSQSVDETQ